MERLREREHDCSAAEIAASAGLSRPTARRYLDHLVSEGLATLRLRYGGGRPQHRYRWSPKRSMNE